MDQSQHKGHKELWSRARGAGRGCDPCVGTALRVSTERCGVGRWGRRPAVQLEGAAHQLYEGAGEGQPEAGACARPLREEGAKRRGEGVRDREVGREDGEVVRSREIEPA